VLALAPPATAQDALGQGDALDANLNASSGPRNVASPQPNFRARNLIVTGNVAAGRGFRGTVGYTAPFDFRGIAGSDANYRFRADSAFSNPEIFRYGNTYQQLRFGQDLGILEYSRRTVGSSPGSVLQDSLTPGRTSRAQRELDRMSMASSVPGMSDRRVQPVMVGGMVDPNQERLVVHASSLQGVYALREGASVGLIGLSPYDLARLRDDTAAERLEFVPGREFESTFDQLRPREPETTDEPRPGEVTDRVDYRRITESIVDRYQSQLPAPAAPDEPMPFVTDAPGATDTPPGTELTDTPPGMSPTAQPPGVAPPRRLEEPSAERLDASFQSLRDRLRDALDERSAPPDETPAGVSPPEGTTAPPTPPPAAATTEVIPLSKLAELLRHGQQLERLAGTGDDRLNELIRRGEEHLGKGDFFRAERSFDHALRLTPYHPMAMAGLAHAQIGAGVHVSAAASVRSLCTEHPEMIDVRYDESLLPSVDVLRSRQAALVERLDDAQHAGEYALLLAYIGHQLGDADAVRTGLETMRRVESGSALVTLLEDVWQPEDE
jgi:hypothetical protein